MAPEQRGEAAFYLPPGQNPAAPELVATTARRARAWAVAGEPLTDYQRHGIADGVCAVVRRLLDTEQQLAALRRALADLYVCADDSPDYGLSAGDVLHHLRRDGIDLAAEIEVAEALHSAQAGVR